jgi:ABC-type amino acid transport substrate-binding protein
MLQSMCQFVCKLFYIMVKKSVLIFVACLVFTPGMLFAQASSDILSPEENLWFEDRSRTIVVQPERNFPPFSYVLKSQTAKSLQGYSIDFIELIAEKIGATIEYKEPRSLDQIMEDVRTGNSSVLVTVAENDERSKYFDFTDTYISVPAVFIVRKDSSVNGSDLSPVDFTGKRVAVGSEYAVESFLKQNYPRIVLEPVSDDEVALQKVLLNDVDAAVLDIASLSHFTSRSVLSSVRIAGTTGFDYELAFAIPKDTPELTDIIQKGLLDVNDVEREALRAKWINFQDQMMQEANSKSFFARDGYTIPLTVAIIGGVVVALYAIRAKRHTFFDHIRKGITHKQEAMDKLEKLEKASEVLEAELKEIKEIEDNIAKTINNIEK